MKVSAPWYARSSANSKWLTGACTGSRNNTCSSTTTRTVQALSSSTLSVSSAGGTGQQRPAGLERPHRIMARCEEEPPLSSARSDPLGTSRCCGMGWSQAGPSGVRVAGWVQLVHSRDLVGPDPYRAICPRIPRPRMWLTRSVPRTGMLVPRVQYCLASMVKIKTVRSSSKEALARVLAKRETRD